MKKGQTPRLAQRLSTSLARFYAMDFYERNYSGDETKKASMGDKRGACGVLEKEHGENNHF